MSDILMQARQNVRRERGLSKLPEATNKYVVTEYTRLAAQEGAAQWNPPAEAEPVARRQAPEEKKTELPVQAEAVALFPKAEPKLTFRQRSGKILRRIFLPNGRVRELHATKGWREGRE